MVPKWALQYCHHTTKSLTVTFIEHLSSCNFRLFTVTTRFVERPAFSIRTVIDLRLFATSIFDNITFMLRRSLSPLKQLMHSCVRLFIPGLTIVMLFVPTPRSHRWLLLFSVSCAQLLVLYWGVHAPRRQSVNICRRSYAGCMQVACRLQVDVYAVCMTILKCVLCNKDTFKKLEW